MNFKRFSILALSLCLAARWCPAETGKVLILHTNDLHDHIRPGYEGVGGVPYVSGYIKHTRSARPDVLVLDAGDVTDKGDLVSFKTNSDIMYEAMDEIGYDATVPGNHDLDHGVPALHAWVALASNMDVLCLNYRNPDGTLCFAPSKVFDVHGVKVGVIGLTVMKNNTTMDTETAISELRKEAERLRPETHLLVVICHLGSKECAQISLRVPAIQVFVSGHTHELLKKPVVVQETGALIVQAGDFARYVGRLELTIDLESRKIKKADAGVIEMRHRTAPCDNDMLAWIRRREQEICPEATRLVGRCNEKLGVTEAAQLAAAALRWHAQADVAFCHAAQIIRSGLPKGDIDVNALFLTGGQRGAELMTATLTGRAIEHYLESLMNSKKERTEWAGFRGELVYSESEQTWIAHTDLDLERNYRVIVPKLEWNNRIERYLVPAGKEDANNSSATFADLSECAFSFIDALSAYAGYLMAEDVRLDAHVKKLAAARRLKVERVPQKNPR